jgi:hypothetical protein
MDYYTHLVLTYEYHLRERNPVLIRSNVVLVPGLIEGLRVVQGLRVVPAYLYRYSMKKYSEKARSPGTTEGDRSDEALGRRRADSVLHQSVTDANSKILSP